MSKLLLFLGLFTSSMAIGQPRIQLSPPKVEVDSVLFTTAATVRLELDYPGVALRYTLDGSPVSQESALYGAPLHLDQTATVRARAFHPDFADSPDVRRTVRSLKNDRKADVVYVSPDPAPKYTGAGLSALTNQQKGALNFAATPEAWLGWETDSLWLKIKTIAPAAANQLTLSLLDNAGAWIMEPAHVQVYQSGELLGATQIAAPKAVLPTRHNFVEVPLPLRRYTTLDVLVLSQTLPEWHDGAGRIAWVFLDEIFLSQMP